MKLNDQSDSFLLEDETASTSASEERDNANPQSSGTDDSPLTETPGLSGDCPSDVPGSSGDADVDFDPEAATRIYVQEWVESLHRDSSLNPAVASACRRGTLPNHDFCWLNPLPTTLCNCT